MTNVLTQEKKALLSRISEQHQSILTEDQQKALRENNYLAFDDKNIEAILEKIKSKAKEEKEKTEYLNLYSAWEACKQLETKSAAVQAAQSLQLPTGATIEYFHGKQAEDQMQANNPRWLMRQATLATGKTAQSDTTSECLVICDKDGKELVRYESIPGGLALYHVDADNELSIKTSFNMMAAQNSNHFSVTDPSSYFGQSDPEKALARLKLLATQLTAFNAANPDKKIKLDWPSDQELGKIFGRDKAKLKEAKTIIRTHKDEEANKGLYETGKKKPATQSTATEEQTQTARQTMTQTPS